MGWKSYSQQKPSNIIFSRFFTTYLIHVAGKGLVGIWNSISAALGPDDQASDFLPWPAKSHYLQDREVARLLLECLLREKEHVVH